MNNSRVNQDGHMKTSIVMMLKFGEGYLAHVPFVQLGFFVLVFRQKKDAGFHG
jgi:hypothetical protein